jgi:glycosyltransferase involved in cell wall biosynthesis
MHVLFIHKIFPAQLGHIARYLVQREGCECTYVFERLPTTMPGMGAVQYMPDFGSGSQLGKVSAAQAGPQYFQLPGASVTQSAPAQRMVEGIRVLEYDPVEQQSVGFDSLVVRAHAVMQMLKAHPEIKPDLVVGSTIYASSMFLPELYDCPVINYCDFYYHRHHSYVDYRPEFPPSDFDVCRARAHNGLVLLDLRACTAAYSPTEWQRNLFPEEYRHKIATIFDGIDRDIWKRRPAARQIGNNPPIPPETRIITYVARGLEALRGFDIFMKVAKRIYTCRRNVKFVVVGADSFYHGADMNYIKAKSFLQHVLQQDSYDLSHFIFTGRVSSTQLADIFSLSDLHIYLTAPFVLSWSLFNALACGCVVLASDTPPVRELIEHEKTGILASFFDVDGLTKQALNILDNPARHRPLAEAGVRLIDDKYSLTSTMPRMLDYYRKTIDDYRRK